MLRSLFKYPSPILLVIMSTLYAVDYHPFGSQQTLATPATQTGLVASLSRKAATHQVAGDEMGNYRTFVGVNKHQIPMLIDTGATFVSLTSEDAEALGLRPKPEDFTLTLNSADGVTKAALMRVACMRIGDVKVENVDVIVLPPGAASGSLLGMSFLRRLGRLEVAENRMTLQE